MSILFGGVSFLSGFILMGFEIISARIIAPLVGTSIYSWASVIGVTLLGLSVGAAAGGYLADRRDPRRLLPSVLLISSVSFLIIPIIRSLAENWQPIAGLPVFSLLLSTLLFLPTALLLGMIQPIVVKLAVTKTERVASIYGVLSMLWSVGSILGVLTTAFGLVAIFGSLTLVHIFALMTGIVACIVLAVYREIGMSKYIAILILGCIIIAVVLLAAESAIKHREQAGGLSTVETDYYLARVKQFEHPLLGTTKVLLLDLDIHSIQEENLYGTYFNSFPLFKQLNPSISRVLVIGGGGYVFPTRAAAYYRHALIDVVEIDEEVTKLAEKEFGAHDPRVTSINEDARTYVKSTDKTYDLIFGDAYSSLLSVPWYLLTQEYFQSLKERLSPGGIYAMNFVGAASGEDAALSYAVEKTFASVFPSYYVLNFGGQDGSNLLFVGANCASCLPDPVGLKNQISKLPAYSFLADSIRVGNSPDLSTADVLTDDFAPVEMLSLGFVKHHFLGRWRAVHSIISS